MSQFTHLYPDHVTISASSDFGSTSNLDHHNVDDCPQAWSDGSDEAGNPVYSEAAISDFLQRDYS